MGTAWAGQGFDPPFVPAFPDKSTNDIMYMLALTEKNTYSYYNFLRIYNYVEASDFFISILAHFQYASGKCT